KIFKIQQKIEAPRLENIEKRVNELLDQYDLQKKVKRGEHIALTAGSRGIKDKPKVLKAIIDRLKDLGASPYVVPCMGSHGGATAGGQVEALESLGISEQSVGAPILSSIEVERIGKTKFGTPVLIGKNICKADKIIVVNRIKLHTDFKGEFESGLIKMMVIGMGKPEGAMMVHRLTIKHGFPAVLTEVGSVILKKLPIFFGMGIIENPYDETAFIELVRPKEMFEKEKTLLKKAKKLMPRLPFDQIDILIVDELGKNVSGAGMDTNVIGRSHFIGSARPTNPKVTRIFVRDLTEVSHGNACGIGMADYTTRRLVEKIDYPSTNINCITGMTPENGRVPIFFERDRDALSTAHNNSGVFDPKDLRILWIKNTLELEYVYASQPFLKEARSNSKLEILGKPFDLPFDGNGNLISKWK
ncbi:MAG TPA: lactate racemase domain-containing protein, partial [Thermodesulfobacteriota bacterium]|nr:lactate racemase domain-containing protein [Thermodesulfobacteriota bacterium]